MLDQLNVMQVTTSAIPAFTFPTVSSYTIGPLDQAQITMRSIQLSTSGTCTMLLPLSFPSDVSTHSLFQQGYETAYLEGELDAKSCTVPELLNDLYRTLTDLRYRHKDPGMYPWTLGFVLGELAYIAECDNTLALVGLAYVCFLLPLFTHPRPSDWPRYEPYNTRAWHDHAIRAYRRRVRAYREQGKSFEEAQRLALC